MTYNKTTGILRNPHSHFSLSSFIGLYCFTDQKDGGIVYFEKEVEAVSKAAYLTQVEGQDVSIKPVQNRFVIILNVK